MSLHVILVRHAESEWHAENRYAGASDIVLTPHGNTQAEALATWAAQAGLSAIWTSPLRRARETAQHSAARAGLSVGVDPRLRELDFGVAEGLTREEMQDRFPHDLAAFQADPVAHHFPKGEHPEAAIERYISFLRELEATRPDGPVLVVGHSTAIRLSLCRLLGLPVGEYRRVFPFLVNCALNELVLSDGVTSLLSLNRPAIPGAVT